MVWRCLFRPRPRRSQIKSHPPHPPPRHTPPIPAQLRDHDEWLVRGAGCRWSRLRHDTGRQPAPPQVGSTAPRTRYVTPGVRGGIRPDLFREASIWDRPASSPQSSPYPEAARPSGCKRPPVRAAVLRLQQYCECVPVAQPPAVGIVNSPAATCVSGRSRGSSRLAHTLTSAWRSAMIISSVCSGVGVMRSRSVPLGTVG